MHPKKTRPAPATAEAQHLEVRPGRMLHWPAAAGGGVRGGAGTVVRADDPLLHYDVRQDQVLQPASPGAEASRHDNPLALALYLRLGYETPPPFRGPGGGSAGDAQAPTPLKAPVPAPSAEAPAEPKADDED